MSADDVAERLLDNLERAPGAADEVEQLAWLSSHSFVWQGARHEVLERMYPPVEFDPPDPGVITYRYLARDRATGTHICLTTTPDDLYADHNGPKAAEEVQADIRRFLSEPDNLLRLARVEHGTGTHYFPRLLAPVTRDSHGRYIYLTEFVPGGSVADIPFEQAPAYRDEFRRAIHIAHLAGVRFYDLSDEDLRILPDGSVMMLDFNMTVPGGQQPFPPQEDFAKLDLLLGIGREEYLT